MYRRASRVDVKKLEKQEAKLRVSDEIGFHYRPSKFIEET